MYFFILYGVCAMKSLSFLDCMQVSGGENVVRLNNGIEMPGEGISQHCLKLFQAILPNLADNVGGKAAAKEAAVKVINAGCFQDYLQLLVNFGNLLDGQM